MDAEQAFYGMEKVQLFGSGQYFSEGDFLVKTRNLKLNSGYKGTCFIAEFEVVESSNTADPVGSTRSWVVMMGPKNKNAMSDIKALFFALSGTDPKKVGAPEEDPALHSQAAEMAKAACDSAYAKKVGIAAGTFEGLPVKLQAFAKATRPTPDKPQGGTFTVHSWSPA